MHEYPVVFPCVTPQIMKVPFIKIKICIFSIGKKITNELILLTNITSVASALQLVHLHCVPETIKNYYDEYEYYCPGAVNTH